jgi:hypothetical protein
MNECSRKNIDKTIWIDKFCLSLIVFGFAVIFFILIKEYLKPIQSLSITDSPESIIKYDLDNKILTDIINKDIFNYKKITTEDLKKIALHNTNYKIITQSGILYLVNKKNNQRISICCFNRFKDNTLWNDIYINDKWIIDVAIDNKYFTKQLLFFKIEKSEFGISGIFDGDYLIKIKTDDFKLKDDILFMYSKDKWIKIDLNTKEVID